MLILIKQIGLTKFQAAMLPYCTAEAESGDLAVSKLFLENSALLGHTFQTVPLTAAEKSDIQAEAAALAEPVPSEIKGTVTEASPVSQEPPPIPAVAPAAPADVAAAPAS